jgi:hypothetical protein
VLEATLSAARQPSARQPAEPADTTWAMTFDICRAGG